MNRRLRAALAVAAVGALTLSQGGIALAQSEEFECEFPTQAIEPIRNVNIMNTAPQLTEVDTDACGNVLSYTETVRSTLDALPWTDVQPEVVEVQQLGVLQDMSGNSVLVPPEVEVVCFSCTENEGSERNE